MNKKDVEKELELIENKTIEITEALNKNKEEYDSLFTTLNRISKLKRDLLLVKEIMKELGYD